MIILAESDGSYDPGGWGISEGLGGIRCYGWCSWGEEVLGTIDLLSRLSKRLIELAKTVQIGESIVQIIFEIGLQMIGVVPSFAQARMEVDRIL